MRNATYYEQAKSLLVCIFSPNQWVLNMTFLSGAAAAFIFSLLFILACWIGYDLGKTEGFEQGKLVQVEWYKNGGRIDLPDGSIVFIKKEKL